VERTARPSRSSVALWALIVVAALVARLRLIDGSIPYPAHLDERQLADPAANILRTGDWNPHQFEYPTLPIYLIAASFAAGYIDAAATERVKRVEDIGSVSFPYYTHRRVVRPARILFALLSILSIALSGVIGYRLTGESIVLWLAPLLLAASGTYLQLSCGYLNVDIVGCTFVTALLALLMEPWTPANAYRRCVSSGVLCGLALASKYNLFTALLPGALAIVLDSARGRLARVGLLFMAAGVTFVAMVPYAVLDVHAFLDGAGGAAHHYAFGHPAFSADPGWHQLSYYVHGLVRDFGWISLPLFFAGVGVALRADWRRTAVLLSFVVGHLLYMSAQRAHFTRNIISVHPVYAVFEGVGWITVVNLCSAALSQIAFFAAREQGRKAAIVCLGVLVAAIGTPWRRSVEAYLRQPDSRKLAAAWIFRSVPAGATLIVARELAMATAPLRPAYHVVELKVRDLDPANVEGGTDAYWLVPRLGFRSPRRKTMGEEANRLLDERLTPLVQFGHSRALLDYPELAPWGDPLLTIGRLRASALEQSAPTPG
jgi:hypothetical protein